MPARTHIRVIRVSPTGQQQSWPTLSVAYRELVGTATEITSSEAQRMRARIRDGAQAIDRHGFTWRSMGGAVSEQTIAWTDFTFGVELEIVGPLSMDQVRRLLPSDWRVVYDGSVTATLRNHYGMEAVSPVLQGEAGITKLREVMDLLRAQGMSVNSSCGMHVHIGVRGMRTARLAKIAQAFLKSERHFDALVPPSRLHNRYCQSNVARRIDIAAVGAASSVSGIAQLMNGGNSSVHYNPYRYYKLNFQSFVRHGTIEFRQHAGTVESAKACAWVRLIAGFCAWAASATTEEVVADSSFEQFLSRSTDVEGQQFMNERRAKFARLRQAA